MATGSMVLQVMFSNHPARQIQAATELISELAQHLDIAASVRLWDGSLHSLGRNANGANSVTIRIGGPGIIASLLRWPTLDRLIRHYAYGRIVLESGTLLDLGEQLGDSNTRKRLKRVSKLKLLKSLLPFLLARAETPGATRQFSGDETGTVRKTAENRDFVQFHYDIGNDFYRLFLDPEMQYSCAYFSDWAASLESAQRDKMDIICRKLRLREGERFLDIGCGWGGLICHAAEHYGVHAHGVTLSDEQAAGTRERIAARGLESRVTVEIKDYAALTGEYDKIASVGMYEHIGIANIPCYLGTVRRLLTPDGLFLNHAISRRSKKKRTRFAKRPEQRALDKYIFPGGELDDIGHTLAAMEQAGFEVHDVEAWRRHYAQTTRIWCERLTARREEAVALVGEEKYRIWVAYLAGCSLAFQRGSARIFQTLVSKSAKGNPPLPPTRADLYG
ncbi:MAG: cyclopropane-fatty-acyl-phospholipid synthase [Alphaproteobacteria bacterium]